MSEQKSLSQAELRQFTGTERWYRHGINHNVLYTDGAKYVADTAGAYWLLDAIAIIQPHKKRVAAEAFQVWRLSVHPDRSGVLTCEDGNGKEVFRQVIPYTDFPVNPRFNSAYARARVCAIKLKEGRSSSTPLPTRPRPSTQRSTCQPVPSW